MKRKTWLKYGIIAIVMVALGTAGYFATRPIQDIVSKKVESPFLAAFNASGANFKDVSVQAWVKTDGVFHDATELEEIYQKIAPEITPWEEEDYLREDYADDTYASISLSGKTEEGFTLEFVLQSIKDDYEEDETYLIVKLTETSDYNKMTALEEKVEAIFKCIEAEPEMNTLLTAGYDKVLSKREKLKMAEMVFDAAGATIVEGVEENNYISKSGYVDGMRRSVDSDGKEINLQFALLDNEVDGETWLYLGTPLVFSEY